MIHSCNSNSITILQSTTLPRTKYDFPFVLRNFNILIYMSQGFDYASFLQLVGSIMVKFPFPILLFPSFSIVSPNMKIFALF